MMQWEQEWTDLRREAIASGVAGGRGQRASWWLARVQRRPALYAHATRSMAVPRVLGIWLAARPDVTSSMLPDGCRSFGVEALAGETVAP